MKTLITVIALVAIAGSASAALIVSDYTQQLIDMEADVAGVFVGNAGAEGNYNTIETSAWQGSQFNSARGPGFWSESFSSTHQYHNGDGTGNGSATLFQADGNNDGDSTDIIGNGGGAGMGMRLGLAGTAGNHAFRLSRETDFASSGMYLRIQNNTGATVTDWNFAADYFYGDTDGNVSVLQFSYAIDNGIDADAMSYTAFGSAAAIQNGDVTANLAGSLNETVTTAGVAHGDYLVLAFNDTVGGTGSEIYIDNIGVTAIPEPATFGLLGLGTLLAVMVRRNRK